ncbi:cobalamin adenosyltransferase [Sporomusa termitida]|uniref:Cobalamin adenosyltransferase-like domain-containing protein n=1 Tax=Sporomusa termitida TaxID=2377 RepID=A0A517DYK0_9FIRM|nr:cobalamin adenosyltransferase [Sporomusa termitida]QDR82454.1 hypothetical protein SPTER_38820 [Sporomusa termitida]
MKFITEMELRALYKTEPFAAYALEPDTKITPGARQFLADRRVTLTQSQGNEGKQAGTARPQRPPGRKNWCILRLQGRMDSTESLFLLTAAELLRCGDAVLSEEVMALDKCFRNMQTAEREQQAPDKIQFWGWSAEEISDRSAHLGKYADVGEIHVGLENGKELALLNHLRASLREIEPAILEAYWDEENQICSRADLIDAVNLIINIVCMMMWKCLGGEKWKR